MPSPNRVYFGFFLFLFVAVGILIILFKTQKSPTAEIKNFDDCVKAGYPVMQAYPPQCTLPSGRFFVRQTVYEKPQ